jgi:hypothetical protein
MSQSDMWINEDVNGIRLDVWEISRAPDDRGDPYHAKAVAIDVETVDRYGHVVARTGIKLSPYEAKRLIDRMHMVLDEANARAGR